MHQAALLDDGEERVRVEQAASRVLPAYERLRAEGGAGCDIDLRLVVQHELVLVEGGVEVLHRFEPEAVDLVEPRVVAIDPRVRVLGRVHRHVGASQQIDDAELAVIALGDAGARVEEQAGPVDDEGRRDPIEDARCDLAAVGGGCEGDQQGELVAAEAHEQVAIPRARDQAAGDLAEQLVAGGMAEGVVDLLEVVQVDQDQREPIGGVRGLEAQRAVLEQRAPVPEPGEIVGDGLTTRAGEVVRLPEGHERPRAGEQQGEGRERHERRVVAE
jgi:hypothetical protein